MATYNPISVVEKDGDSPITVSLIDKLDQNPIAMFEGAAGAPKISNAAFANNSISGRRLFATSFNVSSIRNVGSISNQDNSYILFDDYIMVKFSFLFQASNEISEFFEFNLPSAFDNRNAFANIRTTGESSGGATSREECTMAVSLSGSDTILTVSGLERANTNFRRYYIKQVMFLV